MDGKWRAGRRKKSWCRINRKWTGIDSVEELFTWPEIENNS